MVTDEERQKLIVRQSSLKLAGDLLISEQERSKSEVSIPLESIKKLSKEIEGYVFEVIETPVQKELRPLQID